MFKGRVRDASGNPVALPLATDWSDSPTPLPLLRGYAQILKAIIFLIPYSKLVYKC